jgi:hypothetical protein
MNFASLNIYTNHLLCKKAEHYALLQIIFHNIEFELTHWLICSRNVHGLPKPKLLHLTSCMMPNTPPTFKMDMAIPAPKKWVHLPKVNKSVHRNVLFTVGQELEGVQMLFNIRIRKWIVAYHRILYSNNKDWTLVTCNNADVSHTCKGEEKELDMEEHVL